METSTPPHAPTATKKVYFQTFGCQMNRLDSELLLGELHKDGYAQTEVMDEADLVMFNTCSVRQHAEDKVWSYLGRLRKQKKRNPDLVVGVMGCMAQKEQAELIRRMPHVDLVCGTREFLEVPHQVRRIQANREQVTAFGLPLDFTFYRDVTVRPDEKFAFVSVMRGCDVFCTFCVVPYTRGREISRPPGAVVDEVKRLVDDGVVQVTLLGQTVNSYGKRLDGELTLGDLLFQLNDIDGLRRIHFITSHPNFMDERLVEALAAGGKIAPYLHLPLQSGSNRILKRMNRGYTVEEYRETIHRVRDQVPGIAVASDFIVGFSGETEEDFVATRAAIDEFRFSHSYIFKYSERPGTRASRSTVLPDDIPDETKKRRNRELLETQERVSAELNEQFVGTEVEILVQGVSKSNPDRATGRTPCHRLVHFACDGRDRGEPAQIIIDEATALALYGRRV